MFIVNAAAFFFQVCSICTWYVEFVYYTTHYYRLTCNSPPDGLTEWECNAKKLKLRATAIAWWFGSNAANFVA